MRFNQLKQVLHHFLAARIRLHALYAHLAKHADSERVTLLLNYLAQREAENTDHIRAYIDQAAVEVAETWVDFTAQVNMDQLCEGIYLPANMSSDEVLSTVLDLDKQSLIELQSVRDELGMLAAQQYVDNLIEHQLQRQQQLVHSVHRLDDV